MRDRLNVDTREEEVDVEVVGEEDRGVEAFLHDLSWKAPILSYTSLLSHSSNQSVFPLKAEPVKELKPLKIVSLPLNCV